MSALRDIALCVRLWDWSETSQTALLFTRQHGLVRALAKGSRRPGAPFSGGLELLTLAEIGIILKPAAELGLLTEWDLRQPFPHLRQHLPALHAGFFCADLLQRMTHDRDPHPALFDAAVGLLERLAHEPPALPLVRFMLALLIQTGYAPVLDRDVASGAPLPPAPSLVFDPDLGGLRAQRPGESDQWRVRTGTVQILRSVLENLPDNPDPEGIERAGRLLASYIRHLLGAEPPTMGLVYPDIAGANTCLSRARKSTLR